MSNYYCNNLCIEEKHMTSVSGFFCPAIVLSAFFFSLFVVKCWRNKKPPRPKKDKSTRRLRDRIFQEKCVDLAVNVNIIMRKRLVPLDPMIKEQNELKKRLIKRTDIPGVGKPDSFGGKMHGLDIIGGLDISFDKSDPDGKEACATLSIIDTNSLQPFAIINCFDQLESPYRPGFLGFREVPCFLRVWRRLQDTRAVPVPQVLLIDGNGLLHPRRFGSACHAGVVLNIPTIGVAKQLMCTDGLTVDLVKKKLETAEYECFNRCRAKVVRLHSLVTDEVLGAAVLKEGLKKPIYISAGHRTSLDTAINIAVNTSRYRIPEPIRLADIEGRKAIREGREAEREVVKKL